MADDRQYCTFYIDGLFFGVEVLHVQEVIRYQEMTQVPTAPEAVSGLINLRGQIVTAIEPLLQAGGAERERMLAGYRRLRQALGEPGVTGRAASAILDQVQQAKPCA